MDLILVLIFTFILISYFLILVLYKKSELQRIEITKLTREIAYLKDERKK